MTTTAPPTTLRERCGPAFLGRLPEHMTRLRWTREQVESHQRQELRRLIAHAQQHSPYHAARLAGIDPASVEPDSLSPLPVMTKSEMMARLDDVLTDRRLAKTTLEGYVSEGNTAPRILLDEYLCIASGGSSGLRGVFATSVEAFPDFLAGVVRAAFARAVASGGPPAGGLVIGMATAPTAIHATSLALEVLDGGFGRVVRAPVTLPIHTIVERLNDAQPTLLVGYPGILRELARERAEGRLGISPTAVLSTGEQLTAEVGGEIAAAFGVPPTNSFGSSEGLVGNSEPGDDVFTFASDLAIVELLDSEGRPAEVGQPSAKVLVTNLLSFTQPLIRYELDDVLVREPDDPQHGHLRARVAGRQDQVLKYDACSIHPLVVRAELVKVPQMVEYQVRQTPAGIDVSAIARGTFDVPLLEHRLAEALASAGLADPHVAVRTVDALERDPHTGKVRRFITR